jgi:hypothetical protein
MYPYSVSGGGYRPFGDAPAPSANQVLVGLQPFARDSKGPIDLNGNYGGALPMSISAAWRLKDPDGLRAWSDAKTMGPVFAWITMVNSGDGGNYLGRALAHNADASLWLQALVKSGVIKQPNAEWRKAIEIASFAIDIGDDGAGRTGYNYVVTGVDGYPGSLADKADSVKMPAGIHARAAALVGGSGGGGLHAETVFDAPGNAAAFGKRLVREAKDMPNLLKRTIDRAQVDREIAMLDTGALFRTPADREAFADALVVVKLADRSRGRAIRTLKDAGGGLEAGLAALQKDSDFVRIVANYTSHKNGRKDV